MSFDDNERINREYWEGVSDIGLILSLCELYQGFSGLVQVTKRGLLEQDACKELIRRLDKRFEKDIKNEQ